MPTCVPSAPGCGPSLTRRSFALSSGSAVAVLALGAGRTFAAEGESAPPAQMISIEGFSASGESLGASRVAKVVKSDAEWRAQLSPTQFEVTRRGGTEAAFTGAYWNSRDDGLYLCVCCGTALFDSRSKFESGTGWPSFSRPVSRQNIVLSLNKRGRAWTTSVSCARCDAHLGDRFQDGPPPTGLRYCIDSAALRFVARAT